MKKNLNPKKIKFFAQRYVDWVIRLGRLKFSLLGFVVIAVLALFTQILLSLIFIGEIDWTDLARSIVFGLISAPFVIYFFALLVEKLEHSRQGLAKLVENLRKEVSERIAAEKKLSEALDNIEQTSRDKTRLMATISHELRTPLNGIIGLSRILLDEQLSPQQRNYLKTINVSAVSLGHIFSDIIDLEKIDSKRIELTYKPVELMSFINDIHNFALLMSEQKKLRFQLDLDDNLPQWLMLDYARLSQILWNLINNAVKFTAQGEIRLGIHQQQQQLIFTVSDTGQGIEKSEQEKIFEMYYQVQSDKDKPLGSGIGLAVSKNIAQLMNGDLSVQSELNQGSTFTLCLPILATHKPQEKQHQFPANLRILLVEDIEMNVIVAKSLLEKLGYHIDVAMNGQQAIQKFEQAEYDLLLLDIQLPDISGFQVAQQLREKYENGIYDYLPPLVALTANVVKNKTEYLHNGMDDVLHKPLVLEELSHCLMEFFNENDLMTFEQHDPVASETLLNTLSSAYNPAILQELLDVLGKAQLAQNIALFQQLMPEYMNELNQCYEAYCKTPEKRTALGEQAHKIKGAAASLGLQRLQQLADQLQHTDSPTWPNEVADNLKQLNQYWQQDIDGLQHWLK